FDASFFVVTCLTYPNVPEFPLFERPEDYADFWIDRGCRPDDGVLVEARTEDANLAASCTTSEGYCTLTASFTDIPLTIVEVGLPEGSAPDHETVVTEGFLRGTR